MPAPGFRPDLTIVLPAYNEERRLGPALDELFEYLGWHPAMTPDERHPELGRWEVLVVDDGSTDETVSLVERRPEARGTAARLQVRREAHGGKGAAVRAGMIAADGSRVIFSDADLATPPDQLAVVMRALDAADVVLGSRIQPDGTDRRASQPGYRRFLGRAYHALAAAWVTGPVPDTQCGFKGFRREAAQDLFLRQRLVSIVFDAEIINLARRRGYRIQVVPVQWSDKRGSRMRVGIGPAVRVAWDLMRIPLLHRTVPRRAIPMRAAEGDAGHG